MEKCLVVIVVVALGWPLVQLLLRRDMQQALKKSRRYRIVLAGFGGLYGIAVVLSILGPLEAKAALPLVRPPRWVTSYCARIRGLAAGAVGRRDQCHYSIRWTLLTTAS